jgi:hypothetical protein
MILSQTLVISFGSVSVEHDWTQLVPCR